MRLVNLNCPNCSGELEIDEEKRIATCQYCQSRWYMEDDSLTKLSKLEKRVSSMEHRQQMQTGIPAQRTTYNIQRRTSLQPSKTQRESRPGDAAVSIIMVGLIALVFGWISSMDHSGTMPVLGAFVSGLVGSVFASVVYVKFHRNPANVPFGVVFLVLFLIFFFLGLL